MTGHSIGAALCQMVVLDLALQNYTIQIACALASPRWASRHARDTYNNLFKKNSHNYSYGVINTNDIVSSLPLQFMPKFNEKDDNKSFLKLYFGSASSKSKNWYCYTQVGTIDGSSNNKMILFDYDKCTTECIGEESCDGVNPVSLHHEITTYKEGMKKKYFSS